ncbi:MAG: hypothetical protein AB7E49_00155 [Campylobacterales bacterium]
MRIADSYNPSALLQQQAGLGADAAAQAKANAQRIAQKNETQETPEASKNERQTFDLPLIENMNDEEYEAFMRATQGMSDTDAQRAAQRLQLIAAAYEQSQRLINGGGMIAALSGQEQPSLLGDLSRGDVRTAINEGADVLRRMGQDDQIQSVRLMERLAMALTQKGLNLQG